MIFNDFHHFINNKWLEGRIHKEKVKKNSHFFSCTHVSPNFFTRIMIFIQFGSDQFNNFPSFKNLKSLDILVENSFHWKVPISEV